MSGAVAEQRSGPVGIGGWLILPIIGFVGTILLTGVNLMQGFASFEGLRAIFTAASSAPIAELRLPLTTSLALGFLVIVSAAYCLVLIFSKKAAIVKFATIHYLLLMIAGFVEVWMDYKIHEVSPSEPADLTVARDAIRGVIIACIWIPYFHVSKRVRNTFIDPKAQAAFADSVGNLDTSR
jgi:hypothetical protein